MAQYVIEILDGDRAGEVVPLPERALRIGRKPGNDIVIADEKTSGAHAEIAPDAGRFVLKDLESTNGTLMDGRRVTEVVLSPGDTFVVGRVRLCFRGDQDAARADASALLMAPLGQGRVRPKGSRSMLLMLLLLLAVLAAGGYLWWQQRGGGGEQGGGRVAAPLQQPGNRLPQAVAECEAEDGWNLRAAGLGMQLGGRGNSGRNAFEALRSGAGDFALARTQQSLTVITGRPLHLRGFVRTKGSARAAVRLRFSAADEQKVVPCHVGSALAQSEAFVEVTADVAVPPGCDRADVELLATLPADGDAAWFDDLAVTDGGSATVHDLKLESGSMLVGKLVFGSGCVTVQSGAPVLLGVEPAAPAGRPALQSLQRERLLALTDLGGGFTASSIDNGFAVAGEGAEGLVLLFPAGSGDGLLVQDEDGGFASAAADGSFQTARVLLGSRQSRCLLQLPAAGELRGENAGGCYRLQLPAARFELQLQFRSERQQARDKLAEARRLQQDQPGQALDALRLLVRQWPHDDDTLAEARRLRTELKSQLEAQLAQLRSDFEEAGFFDTRGGFERVLRGIDAVLQGYGKANLDDEAALMQLRAAALQQLQQLDAARTADRRARLQQLADSLHQSQEPQLEQLVRDYLEQHGRDD